MEVRNYTTLIGKVFTSIELFRDAIKFKSREGETYSLCHLQDCCEEVTLEDITGDLEDLTNTPILKAEVVTNSDMPPKDLQDESHTWTFAKIATVKGGVTVRFYGTSNGHYSEDAQFCYQKDDGYFQPLEYDTIKKQNTRYDK